MHPRILPFAFVATALTGLIAVPALAREYSTPLHRCVNAALAKKPGRVHEVELETKDGKEVYEIDIVGKDGKRWELLCDLETISIVKVELEEDHDDDGYPAKAKTQGAGGPGVDVITPQPIFKVSEDKAKQIALGQYPGTISEVVYEYSNGRPGYEVHIRGNRGQRIEVEIDGITGDITEVSEKPR
jgi:uncharacterized membrane protein YkoI